MELGGKSPVLIFEDADIERAGRRAVHHLLDQRRTRTRRVAHLYPAGHLPEFVKRFCPNARIACVSAIRRTNAGRRADWPTALGKVSGYIRLGIERGATLLAGGAETH